MQSITCPNCGAPATNHKNCEFCGSLFVRFADKQVDLSQTIYLKNDYVYLGLEEELSKNIKLQENEPTLTNIIIRNEVGNTLTTIRIIPSNSYIDNQHNYCFSNSTVGMAVSFTFDFYEDFNNEEVKKLHDRFTGLKSVMLFERKTSRLASKAIDSDILLVSNYYNQIEYSIDFGKDVEGASRLLSEIIHEVYSIPYNAKLEFETLSFADYQKKEEKRSKSFDKKLRTGRIKFILPFIFIIILGIIYYSGLFDSILDDTKKWEATIIHGEDEKIFHVGDATIYMVKIDGGTFQMGSKGGMSKENYYTPNVTLSNYYIGKFEVTCELWRTVMNTKSQYSRRENNSDKNLPVSDVSWLECQEFITLLNSLLSNQLGGMKFRLPTEAEWEFAARGGNKSTNCFNYAKTYSSFSPSSIGRENCNELTLYDMEGNVSEWCYDFYEEYTAEDKYDPKGAIDGLAHVFRGGNYSRSEYYVWERFKKPSNCKDKTLGLRLALSN